jgi:uncharacterized protein with FMN-binding domain
VRRRAVVASVISSAAVLGIGWQAGQQSVAGPLVASESPAAADPASSPPAAPSPTAVPSAPAGEPSTAATPTPSPSPSAAASGSFTGSSVRTRYGTVQVQITVENGTIVDATTVQLTADDQRSAQINNRAAPILRSEVLAAQSASVSTVSGATYTSAGYLKSLQSALDQAGL